jgi:hypothetical protein
MPHLWRAEFAAVSRPLLPRFPACGVRGALGPHLS